LTDAKQFFLDLWEDVKSVLPEDLDEVSKAALQRLRGTAPEDTLFSTYASHFDTLASKAEEIAVKHVQMEVLRELKPYFAKRWDVQTEEDAASSLALSPELTGPLTLYSTLLAALKEALPVPQLQSCYRKIASTFSEHLYGRIATAKVFSQIGGQQFLDDVRLGWEEAPRANGVRRPEVALAKLKSAAVLLALPTGEDAGGPFGKMIRAAWDSDDKYTPLAEELGVANLTRKEAQAVLKKRPECWRA
jgi:hypothetical protein